MNDYKELIKVLRNSSVICTSCKHYPKKRCSGAYILETIDAIEQLVADRNAARNELCGYCGKYKDAHLGACDGCKWRD